MPKKLRSYSSWRMEKLGDPAIAAHYLNEALAESPEVFLAALRNVAQARQMKRVAAESGVTRESLYRALSAEGNPTLETLSSVLSVLGLKIAVTPELEESISAQTPRPRRVRSPLQKHR